MADADATHHGLQHIAEGTALRDDGDAAGEALHHRATIRHEIHEGAAAHVREPDAVRASEPDRAAACRSDDLLLLDHALGKPCLGESDA
jgi:hypothetical protein